MGLGAVLDDPETSGLGQLEDVVHLAGPAGQVHRDDGLSAWRERRFDGLGREVLALGINVCEDGRGAHDRHGTRGGHEGAGGHHDLVARADAHGSEGRLEGHGAVHQGNCVGASWATTVAKVTPAAERAVATRMRTRLSPIATTARYSDACSVSHPSVPSTDFESSSVSWS